MDFLIIIAGLGILAAMFLVALQQIVSDITAIYRWIRHNRKPDDLEARRQEGR